MIKINLGNISMGNEDYKPTISLPDTEESIVVEEIKEAVEMHEENTAQEDMAVQEDTSVQEDAMQEINEVREAITVHVEQPSEEVVLNEEDMVQKQEPAYDSCPVCKHAILFGHCEEVKTYTVQDTYLDGQGRILDISLKIKKVCPHKRVALGVAVVELDELGREYPRGLKTITIPAHHAAGCQDIPVGSIRFILPEDISVGGSSDMCQSSRRFRVRVTAHYIDVACTMGS